MNAVDLLAMAEREGVRLSEPVENRLRVEGEASDKLMALLMQHKIGILAELWRRANWEPDWLKDWRRHCIEEWKKHQQQSVSLRDDPRPDLQKDHGPWCCILQVVNGDMLGVLHGLRCLGAELYRNGEHWQLRRGEISEDEYQDIRKHVLAPNGVHLVMALDALSDYRRWHDGLVGDDWRPILQPDDAPVSEIPRLWFERKDGEICSIT